MINDTSSNIDRGFHIARGEELEDFKLKLLTNTRAGRIEFFDAEGDTIGEAWVHPGAERDDEGDARLLTLQQLIDTMEEGDLFTKDAEILAAQEA